MSPSKNSPSPARKQTLVPGPASAAYKKRLAAQNVATTNAGASPATIPKSGKKQRKFSAKFTSLKSRQMVVERVKRAIWAAVLDINDAIINLALCGNYNAAKALFDFAGVYSLPVPDAANPAAGSSPAPLSPEGSDPNNPVDAFFRSIGVKPPCEEPVPDMPIEGV